MKTLIYGAGPIGHWLALRLGQANEDEDTKDDAQPF